MGRRFQFLDKRLELKVQFLKSGIDLGLIDKLKRVTILDLTLSNFRNSIEGL